MLAKRVIPCLDVKDGRVVKGVQFVDLRDAGDPVEAALAYDAQGADELVFLDITASHEARDIMLDVVRRTAEGIYMPLTVGGGIRSVDDVRRLLRAGAAPSSIATRGASRVAPTRCWRRRSSTSGRTRSPRRRPTCASAASRCGASRDARRAQVRRPGADPGRCPGSRYRRDLDGRVDGPPGRRGDAGQRSVSLLVTLAGEALAEGRDVRSRAARAVGVRRLRRRRITRPCPPGGRRLPHGTADVLLHAAEGRREDLAASSSGGDARTARACDRGEKGESAGRIVRR